MASTYLIAHTNEKGTNVAQANVVCNSASLARNAFAHHMPQRIIVAFGEKGVG